MEEGRGEELWGWGAGGGAVAEAAGEEGGQGGVLHLHQASQARPTFSS